ncbi:hypothetical protein ACJRO7_021979 [Eucalyptus globulus]|uniref:Stigma-specific STIG1-like protein 1 n=1 Tax=Eucalyptus globulus TaxID=34317 RepID=A0ABD3KP34_EUCGL
MKLSNSFCIMLVLLCLTLVNSEVPGITSPSIISSSHEDESSVEAPFPLHLGNRFLAEGVRATMTCDKYPRVCRATGSPGPDCCNKQCVDVATDRLNCGACRKRCKYGEMCCHGKCVNPSVDEKHCGRCGNKCSKGSSCVHGLCNYA